MSASDDIDGYYKVVFKKTFALFGDLRNVNGDMLELTLNNGQILLFNKDDLLLAEEARRLECEA